MSVRWIAVAASLDLAVAAPSHGASPALDVSASDVVLEFWGSLKAGDADAKKFVAADATLSMMELGGGYDHEIMSDLAANCELVAMMGSTPKGQDDPTGYVWAVVECAEDGRVDTVPIGFGVQGREITQILIDLLTPISINRSILGEGADE